MQFAFDPAKSASNKLKHGIDFEEAQALWQDENGVTLVSTIGDEERFLYIAKMPGTSKTWAAIFTHRGEAIRIISCRRARAKEEQTYDQNQNQS
ncbi:MAG: BrnT family toxin [Verrucomicrobia bacterium]|nr:BrnT family toxin [Verrucomicrobiota bacterium]